MSRKDYALIAEVLRRLPATDALAREFAYALREQHRAFNVDKFLVACRPDPGSTADCTPTTHGKVI